MNRENPLPIWARQILMGAGLFLFGTILAFGYSYRPLHGALTWQVEQLETRLDDRNRENLRLIDRLAKQEADEVERIDPETFTQVERELDQTRRALDQAEKDLARSERKRKSANLSATKWKKRFNELDQKVAPVAAPAPVSSLEANVETSIQSKSNPSPATDQSTQAAVTGHVSNLADPNGPSEASPPTQPSKSANESGILPSRENDPSANPR